MDIVAHALWAGLGGLALRRHLAVQPRHVAGAMLAAAVPDLVQMVPVVAWALFGGGTLVEAWALAVAVPGAEPLLPPAVAWWSHHLHCVMHSAPVALVVSLLAWRWKPSLWLPLLGWWSHIVVDVFTHSAEFYPSPVLYPFTQQGFDGLAWNEPWFVVLNYLALATVAASLVVGHATKGRRR